MQKSTFWAITGFMVMGIILSFTSMGIFLVKYDQDKQVLIKQKSTLTEYEYLQFSANALNWGATPGYKNVTQINQFKLFSHVGGIAFEEGQETLNYSYVSEISNRTYVPSSPGYIKFLPSFKFQKLSDNGTKITNLNIAAIQYFYKSFHSPAFVKLPRYLTMLFRGLSEDLINYYFTHTIYEFYTNDQQSVYDTIFTPAKITADTKEKLWNDELYGWKSEKTFRKWITAHFNGGDNKIQQYFQLTDDQMKGLIGKGSIIDKLRKLIINSVSTGVAGKDGSCAIPTQCTYWELGVIQWAFGGLTAKDFVPPVQFGGGSFATYNDSIPKIHEFYLTGHDLQLGEVTNTISQIFEQKPNLLNFDTMQYIWENRESKKRICNKLGWNVDQDETQDKAGFLVDYLKQQYDYVNTIEDTYAFQTWRFMSKMINEAGYMLRDGLHAKAIFYSFKAVQCKESFLIPFDNVCDTKYDFTIAPENALLWVNAALENKHSESFKKLVVGLQANDEVLADYLYEGLSDFSKQLNIIKNTISKFYGCQYSPCQAEELWYKQWGSSYVTSNYPPEIQFWDTDKVSSISQWDIYQSRNFVHYEFFSYSQIRVSESVQQQLFQFDMGGIFGYYSLRNLFEYHFNNTKPLSNKFPMKGDDLDVLIAYIKDCLVNYWYGGQIITTEGQKYLFDYDNIYTDDLTNFEPIYEGVFWRDNGAHLIEPNNNEFRKQATMYDYYFMDTGIKNIDNVGKMIKTLDESKLRQKFIIYYNEATDFLTTYYKYPYGFNAVVDGSYGYAFKPNLDDEFEQKLQLFDFEIQKNISLRYHTQSKHHDYNVYEYRLEDTTISLEQAREIPVFITLGNQNLNDCATVNKKTCQEYMYSLPLSFYQIEEVTGTVVKFQKTYVYWLKLDQTNPLRQGDLYQEMYIPLATRTVSYEYNEDQMNQHFKSVKELQSTKKTLFIISLLFGILFTLGFVGVIVFFRKNEHNIKSRAPSVYSVLEAD